MNYLVHPSSLCEAKNIGDGTSISAFSRIHEKAIIGKNVTIGEHAFIENDVSIGDNVIIQSGVTLCNGIRVLDDVFIGANATFTRNLQRRSAERLYEHIETVICKKASIGANATILPGITVGQNAMVGAGAVVTHPVPPHAIVVGNPARIVGYVDSRKATMDDNLTRSSMDFLTKVKQTRVKGVTLHRLSLIRDMRGNLTVGEFEREVPFVPKRYFMVFDVPNTRIRGEHAHRLCRQFIVCVKGSFAFVADDGTKREEFMLESPSIGVYIPPLVWGVQYKHSHDSATMVFASDYYDPADYIRDYDEFLSLTARQA